MVIRGSDPVTAVLRRDGALLDVFVRLSPVFERLCDPEMGRVMSRLVTVDQAASMAGIDGDELVRRLNATLGEQEPATVEEKQMTAKTMDPAAAAGMPGVLEGMAKENIVEVDVREDLRAGREPFSRIMAALKEVPEGGALALRAIFEPVPLYAVLAKRGLSHYTEQLAADDWRVWFYAEAMSSGAEGKPERSEPAPEADPAVVILDVRDLEPPEPMVRTLAALEELPPGGTLLQINVRVPQFLLPRLEERGFTYEIREQAPDLVRVFIRHGAARQTNSEALMTDTRTLDVRVIPPREKHPTIFHTFNALEPGESFVLVNDHDPKPLRYQFEFEHAGQFGWEYLEQGPAIWRVEIRRTAK
jgi:uncharacterized protein (DUF2249 family)